MLIKDLLLAISANTKCRPFQIKINCSKAIIGGFQQWCYMTFFVSLFLIAKCISAKENYYNLTKIAVNFRQVSLKGVLLPVSVLEFFGKIF